MLDPLARNRHYRHLTTHTSCHQLHFTNPPQHTHLQPEESQKVGWSWTNNSTSPDMVSRLWKTGTITVLPLSFLTAICTTAKHTSEPTNWGSAARNDPYENPIHPARAGAEAIGERGERERSLPASAPWRRRRRWRCRTAAWTLRRCSSGHTHTETEKLVVRVLVRAEQGSVRYSWCSWGEVTMAAVEVAGDDRRRRRRRRKGGREFEIGGDRRMEIVFLFFFFR